MAYLRCLQIALCHNSLENTDASYSSKGDSSPDMDFDGVLCPR